VEVQSLKMLRIRKPVRQLPRSWKT